MDTGSTLVADIDSCSPAFGEVAFWWLGQHSVVVKFGGAAVYFDPYLAPNPKRNVPPLLRPEEIRHAAVVLGTHDHADHIDRPSLPALLAASPQASLLVPGLVKDALCREAGLCPDRVVGMEAGRTVEVGGVRVSAVPAAHEFLDRDPDTGRYPYLGYVVQGNGVTVYHAGDTCIYRGMHEALEPFDIDLAFLPINGRDAVRYARHCIGNMTYQEAADLAGFLRPRLTVPMHFDMFPGNTADPEPFRAYLAVKYPDRKCCVPQHGVRTFCSP